MRLDARCGDHDWFVWECELMAQPKNVVWVDSATARYGVHPTPLRIGPDHMLVIETIQAKRITILFESKLVLINPIPEEQTGKIRGTITRKHLAKQ